MTLNIEDTPEQATLQQAEAALADLKREREEYLAAASDPRAPRPWRSLSEIRDDIEVAEARLAKAKEAAEAAAAKVPDEAAVRALLTKAITDRTAAVKKLESAGKALDKAIAAMRAEVADYNTSLEQTRRDLIAAGIPVRGADLDGEPIDLTRGRIQHGVATHYLIPPEATEDYLTAAAAKELRFPEQRGGWSFGLQAYQTGTFWRRAAGL